MRLGGSDPDTSQGTLGPCHKVSATLKGQHVQRCLAVGPYFAGFTLLFSSGKHLLNILFGRAGNTHPFPEEKSLLFVPQAEDKWLRGAGDTLHLTDNLEATHLAQRLGLSCVHQGWNKISSVPTGHHTPNGKILHPAGPQPTGAPPGHPRTAEQPQNHQRWMCLS